MYEAFYGLSSKPFQLNPDPSFYFGSKQHRRAKDYLDYGVSRNEGFIVITGEVGAGKTTLLGELLKTLDRKSIVVGQIATTQLDAENMLRMVGAAFGFRVTDVPKSTLLITLEAFLLTQSSQGKRCLLIIDEAQNLSLRAVEELRMLSNYQLGTQSLLQSFLIAQPEFRHILARPEMEQFRQRVAASCHIGPLDAEDTQHYIEHRLRLSGARDKPQFGAGVFEAIYGASSGIPRRINVLCDRLLLQGYLSGRTSLSVADVNEVAQEFAEETSGPVPRMNGEARPLSPQATPVTLEPETADRLSRHLTGLITEDEGNRLQRLEEGLQRLEQINLKTLALLRELVEAMGAPGQGKKK